MAHICYGKSMKKSSQRIWYGVLAAGAALGGVASFMQLLEKIQLLKNPDASLLCNLNSVFNCTNVLNAPQSAVFGFPNALMSLILFIVFMTVGLVGLTSGIVARRMRIGTQLLSLFTLGFGLWFLWQSTFYIGAICLYCLLNFSGLILVNIAWVRINSIDVPNAKSTRLKLQGVIAQNYDLVAWGLITIGVLLTIYLRLGIS